MQEFLQLPSPQASHYLSLSLPRSPGVRNRRAHLSGPLLPPAHLLALELTRLPRRTHPHTYTRLVYKPSTRPPTPTVWPQQASPSGLHIKHSPPKQSSPRTLKWVTPPGALSPDSQLPHVSQPSCLRQFCQNLAPG